MALLASTVEGLRKQVRRNIDPGRLKEPLQGIFARVARARHVPETHKEILRLIDQSSSSIEASVKICHSMDVFDKFQRQYAESPFFVRNNCPRLQ